jgi:hypothetical protein
VAVVGAGDGTRPGFVDGRDDAQRHIRAQGDDTVHVGGRDATEQRGIERMFWVPGEADAHRIGQGSLDARGGRQQVEIVAGDAARVAIAFGELAEETPAEPDRAEEERGGRATVDAIAFGQARRQITARSTGRAARGRNERTRTSS